MQETGFLTLLNGCRNDCLFCIMKKEGRKENNNLKNQELLISNKLEEFKQSGIKKIQISGSDPLEYSKIIPLVKYIKDQGFQHITIATHGMNLHDLNFSKEIISSGADTFTVPIYGSIPVIHDSVTRNSGSYDKTIRGIKNVISLNKEIVVSSMILEQNKHDLINIINLVNDLDIHTLSFNMTYMTNDNDSSYFIPVKDIGKYIDPIYDHILKLEKRITFLEFPYCVFDIYNPAIFLNLITIFNQSSKYSFLGDKKDIKIPEHRIMEKIRICKKCKANDYCDGFFKKDIDKYGIGNLKPII